VATAASPGAIVRRPFDDGWSVGDLERRGVIEIATSLPRSGPIHLRGAIGRSLPWSSSCSTPEVFLPRPRSGGRVLTVFEFTHRRAEGHPAFFRLYSATAGFALRQVCLQSALLPRAGNAKCLRRNSRGARSSCGCIRADRFPAKRCASAGSWFTTYKSISRVPRLTTGFTIVESAPPKPVRFG